MRRKRAELENLIYMAIVTWDKDGYGPSFRDVAEATGAPLGSVHEVCRDLRTQGRITFTDNIARSLRANRVKG